MAHPGPPIPNLFAVSPVRSTPNVHNREFPLSLIALIVSFLEDVADIARIVRTSRLLYYMTLPRLYEHVTLRSYSDIRYINGRPEGMGGGSPFATALNGLVVRDTARYVKTWRLVGEWKESDVDEFAKGRVPDNSMLLNITVRAAMDKMGSLESFGWELNTKPLNTVYQGLIAKPTLKSLTIRFPSTRVQRPTVVIPPLPNLRVFKAYDMDPLCYPDDISLLLLQSKKLEDLRLHWSPRMRNTGEESIHLHTYFGRCIAANYKLKLKCLSFHNMFCRPTLELEHIFDSETMESLTFINCTGTDPMTVFLDDIWRMHLPKKIPTNLKYMRGDVLEGHHISMLSAFSGLERVYQVSTKEKKALSKPSSASVTPTPAADGSPVPPSPSSGKSVQQERVTLASDFIAAITTHHGATMRHLLLSDEWDLNLEVVIRLARSCPNLEQLGFATSWNPVDLMRKLIPHVPKLRALRIMVGLGSSEIIEKLQRNSEDLHVFIFGSELWRPEYRYLKYFGLGELVFELGETTFRPQKDGPLNRKKAPFRKMRMLRREQVRHVEIWGLDSLEL